MSIRVLIIDEHLIVRQAIERLLLDAGLNVVGHLGFDSEILGAITAMSPEVILLDVRMPEMDGWTVLKRLRSDRLTAKVLLLTGFYNEACLLRAAEYGVDGVLSKSMSGEELISAIRSAVAGLDDWIPPLPLGIRR